MTQHTSTACLAGLLSCLALLFGGSPAFAQSGPLKQPNGFTWGELAVLPEYCKDTQSVLYGDASNPSPNAPKWLALMGQDFWHMHHYCWGMREQRRALDTRNSPRQRQAMRERVVSEMKYIIANASPDMVLMPEVYWRLGDAQLVLGNVADAEAAYTQSRRLKRDYWPAYTSWIDVLIDRKLIASARELTLEGLKYAPDAPELQKRLKQLGGEKRQGQQGRGQGQIEIGQSATASPK